MHQDFQETRHWAVNCFFQWAGLMHIKAQKHTICLHLSCTFDSVSWATSHLRIRPSCNISMAHTSKSHKTKQKNSNWLSNAVWQTKQMITIQLQYAQLPQTACSDKPPAADRATTTCAGHKVEKELQLPRFAICKTNNTILASWWLCQQNSQCRLRFHWLLVVLGTRIGPI